MNIMLYSNSLNFTRLLIKDMKRGSQLKTFTNVGMGIGWSIITYTTVGYGDVVPITPLGKFLAGFIAVIGIVTLMLPTGILSSALLNKLQQENAKKIKEEEEKNKNSQTPTPG